MNHYIITYQPKSKFRLRLVIRVLSHKHHMTITKMEIFLQMSKVLFIFANKISRVVLFCRNMTAKLLEGYFPDNPLYYPHLLLNMN